MKKLATIFFAITLALSCNKEPDEPNSCCDLPSNQTFRIAYVDKDTNNLVPFPSNTSYSIDDIELKGIDTNLVKIVKRKFWPQDSATEMYVKITRDGLDKLPLEFTLQLNKQRTENIKVSGTVPNLSFVANGVPLKKCNECSDFAYKAYLFFK